MTSVALQVYAFTNTFFAENTVTSPHPLNESES